MTIKARNNIRLLFLIVSFFIFAFAVMVYIFSLINASYSSLYLPKNLVSLLGNADYVFSYSPLSVSTVILFFCTLSFASQVYIYFAFRKIQSVEMVFFEVFLFSLSFEALRLLPLLFSFSSSIMIELSYLAKLLYFFRFLSIFALLGMSLFSIKTVTNQTSFIVFLLLFLSFMLSMAEPFDSSNINYLFTAGSALTKTYLTLFVPIVIFLVLTVVLSYIYNSIPERYYIIWAYIALLAGYVILLVSYNYAISIFAIILFIYGVFNMVKNIHSIYVWQ